MSGVSSCLMFDNQKQRIKHRLHQCFHIFYCSFIQIKNYQHHQAFDPHSNSQVQKRTGSRPLWTPAWARCLQPCSWVHLADHGLSQGLQHLPLVVIKVAVDLVDGPVLHHPQLALGLRDEPGVMADDDHSCKTGGAVSRQSRAVRAAPPPGWMLLSVPQQVERLV